MEMFRRGGICFLGYQFRPFLRFFYWIVVEMFRRGGICLLGTFSTVFLLDCGGLWWINGICLLGYQF